MDTSRVYFKGLLNLKIDQAFFEDKDEKALRFYTSSLEKLEALLYQYKTLHIFKVSLQRHKLGTGRISEDFIKKVIGKQTSEKTIVGAFTYTGVTPELKYETNIFFLTVGESLSKPYTSIYETFKDSRASKLTSQFGISAPMYHDLAYSVRDTVELFKQLSIFEGLKGDLRERGFYRVKFYSTLPHLGGELDFTPKDVGKRINGWFDRILDRLKKLFHV